MEAAVAAALRSPTAAGPSRRSAAPGHSSLPFDRRRSFAFGSIKLVQRRCLHAVAGRTTTGRREAAGVMRSCFNPLGDERVLREAIKEPVAFLGGVFAGLLRLDLNEDPLKEWITRTVEASGIAEEISSEESSEADQNDAPQQIEIE